MKLQKNKECFFCGTTENLHKHHVFNGPSRKASEKWGCWVWLCGAHHNLSSDSVHMNQQKNLIVKRYTQKCFEEEYGHEKFMQIFHKNYL